LTIEPLGLGQQRAERHAGPERAGEIDVEHLNKGLDLVFLVAREDAGAIDQRIDAAMPLRKGCDRGVVGDVERRQLKPRPRLERRPGKIGLVDGGGGNSRAQFAEQLADGSADIAGAADHDGMKTLGQREGGGHRDRPCRFGGVAVDSRTTSE